MTPNQKLEVLAKFAQSIFIRVLPQSASTNEAAKTLSSLTIVQIQLDRIKNKDQAKEIDLYTVDGVDDDAFSKLQEELKEGYSHNEDLWKIKEAQLNATLMSVYTVVKDNQDKIIRGKMRADDIVMKINRAINMVDFDLLKQHIALEGEASPTPAVGTATQVKYEPNGPHSVG